MRWITEGNTYDEAFNYPVTARRHPAKKTELMISSGRSSMFAAALVLGFVGARDANARDPLEVTLETNGQSDTRGFNSVGSAVKFFENPDNWGSLVPAYRASSVANLTLDWLGTRYVASYAEGSNDLQLRKVSTNETRIFPGGNSRRASADLAVECFERGESFCRPDIGSGPNPFNGGPDSIFGQMAAADQASALNDAVQAGGGFGAGIRISSFSASGYRTNSLSLPLNHTWRLSERDTVQIDVPIGFTDLEGAKSYGANLGLLWRRRMTSNWTLQPSLRFGGVGSVDLGMAAGVWSAALNSTLNLDLPANWQLTIANGVSYISTIPVSVGRWSFNYDISNVVFRNGAVASRDLGFRLAGYPARGALFAIDTRFTGNAIYIDNFQEFGAFVSIETLSPIRLGVSYLTGARGVQGFAVNLGARF